MAYFPHHSVRTPGREQTLWRYMDLAKLADLLVTKSLYFPTIAQLGDPWEGTLPEIDAAEIDSLRAEHGVDLLGSPEGRWFLDLPARQRARAYVSCWHANATECHAMWSMYADGQGVAVRTTVGRLIDAADSWLGGRVYIGWVDYVDFEVDRLAEQLFPGALFSKDVSYRHEQEVRALVLDAWSCGDERPPTGHGIRLTASPSALLECVVPSPSTPDWVVRVIEWLLNASACQIPLQPSRFRRTGRL